jgi:hypothetical protein
MEAQILRPLQWFGLLEHREEKTDLGDLTNRHLSFDVRLKDAEAAHH